jgi:hypothetical protein
MLLCNQDEYILPRSILLIQHKYANAFYSGLKHYSGKYNISGKKRLASITNPAVKDSHTVHNTGAVDKYFKKLLSIIKRFYFKVKSSLSRRYCNLASISD